MKDGAKKQWSTQAVESVTATLSEFIWVFNIDIYYFPMLLITTVLNNIVLNFSIFSNLGFCFTPPGPL